MPSSESAWDKDRARVLWGVVREWRPGGGVHPGLVRIQRGWDEEGRIRMTEGTKVRMRDGFQGS